jgi:hypothetical protein
MLCAFFSCFAVLDHRIAAPLTFIRDATGARGVSVESQGCYHARQARSASGLDAPTLSPDPRSNNISSTLLCRDDNECIACSFSTLCRATWLLPCVPI